MAYEHDEIVKDLGDGWSIHWNSTQIDPVMRAEFDRVIAENTKALREIVGDWSPRCRRLRADAPPTPA